MNTKPKSSEVSRASDGSSVAVPATVTVREIQGTASLGRNRELLFSIGPMVLATVIFDNRYDDGAFYVVLDDRSRSERKRFHTKGEAAVHVFSRLGLECPSGFCDV